jgi:sn-glycerol 3-phosphate transport system permease protein
MVSPQRAFVGWRNFETLIGDPDFRAVLWQSLQYVGIALLGNFLLPLGLAMLMLLVGDRRANHYQALLFTPTVVATSVGALLWMWIYLPAGGLLNAALALAGLPGATWLTDPDTALSAVGWTLLAGVVLPNVFVPIQILTQGGPASASTNILYSVYETGFRFFQVGKASAEAVLTMLLLAVAAFAYFRLLDRRLIYDR